MEQIETHSESADLVQLVDQCRGVHSKRFMAEIVKMFHIGAYRSCVVAIWVAVVYDIVEKLQTLGQLGDRQAEILVIDVDGIRQRNDVPAAQAFEASVLDKVASDFEFFTPNQMLELGRLREDRHRCAHPAYQQMEEPFVPSREATLAHMRHAVEYVFSQPPVQGKRAVERLMAEVCSEYFPTTPGNARKWLEDSALKRARESLVRNFTVVLLKELLLQERTGKREKQYLAALHSTIVLYPNIMPGILRRELDPLLSRVSDLDLDRGVRAFAFVPRLSEYVGGAQMVRLRKFVENGAVEELPRILKYSVRVLAFRTETQRALRRMKDVDLVELMESTWDSTFLNELVRRYSEAKNFSEANSLGSQGIIPLALWLDDDQIAAIRNAFIKNSQVRESLQGPRVVAALMENLQARSVGVRADWEEFVRVLSDVLNGAESRNAAMIVARHFDLPLPVLRD